MMCGAAGKKPFEKLLQPSTPGPFALRGKGSLAPLHEGVVSNSPSTRVVTIGISLLQGERSTSWNLLMMGSLLATLPMLILFMIMQRYFIEGISSSGLKR